jgi:hypothetical protein
VVELLLLVVVVVVVDTVVEMVVWSSWCRVGGVLICGKWCSESMTNHRPKEDGGVGRVSGRIGGGVGGALVWTTA